MYFCFILSPLAAPLAQYSARRIAGREWALDVVLSPNEGPFYPQIAEQVDPRGYRFFAGRIAGIKPSAALPAGHPVTTVPADDWSFSGDEPGGSWIALKFDRERDAVSIASDVFLVQRWYYAQIAGRWYFSNSLLFLHRLAQPQPGIEERSVPYMLLFNYLPNRYTPLHDVFGLRPAQSVTVERGELRTAQRAHLPLERPNPQSFAGTDAKTLKEQVTAGALAVLREAVAAELEHLDTVTVPLSGGMDSRIILGCALDVMPRERIITYTYGRPNTYDFRFGTGLAVRLGLRNIPVPMDPRPLDEILADGFRCSEGMRLVFPNNPIGPLRDVLQPGTHVLSGFLGETIWGVEDLAQSAATGDLGEQLFKIVWSKALEAPFTSVRRMLTTDNWDALGYEAAIRALPGATLDERYSRWFAGDRDTNRINFGVQMHRDHAYFLTPHVHSRVVRFAHGMPVELRRGGVAYYAALKSGFPELYHYPTTRNFGYPIEQNVTWRRRIVRRWWLAMSQVEKIVFRFTGDLFFNPPLGRQYAHPLELQRKKHRAAMLRILDELEPMTILDPQGIAALRDAYYHRRPHPSQLLRALITIQQWQKYYGKSS
jgi:hypothetical protein